MDFLEANPKYSICWGSYLELHMLNNEIQEPSWKRNIKNNLQINFDNIFTPYCTYTLTALYRNDCLDLNFMREFKYLKDNTLYILCLTKGLGFLMNDNFGVYRIHNNSIYSSLSEYEKVSPTYLNIKEALKKISRSGSDNLINVKKALIKRTLELMPKEMILVNLKYFYFGLIEMGMFSTCKLALKRLKYFKLKIRK